MGAEAGSPEGAALGAKVVETLGISVGKLVLGVKVGKLAGAEEGALVGLLDGAVVVGTEVVGKFVEIDVGVAEGASLGIFVGM